MRVAAVAVLSVSCLSAATLQHDYRFQNNLLDSLAGPALMANGGTVASGRYNFGPNQGLSLSNGFLNAANYSIVLQFQFANVDDYRKVVDFKNRTSDMGQYIRDGKVYFYSAVENPVPATTANTPLLMVLTRETGGTVRTYVNGVQQIQFNDAANDAVFNAANNVAWFFQDDVLTSGEFSAGSVYRIQIYDGALTAGEVAALNFSTVVPEPSTMLMLSVGLAAAAIRLRGRSA